MVGGSVMGSPRCVSWRLKVAACAHRTLPGAGCRCWVPCRERVDQTGLRCGACWKALIGSDRVDLRMAAAAELASGLFEDPLDDVWKAFASDPSREVRLELVGVATPLPVLRRLSVDDEMVVRVAVADHAPADLAMVLMGDASLPVSRAAARRQVELGIVALPAPDLPVHDPGPFTGVS